MKKALLVLALVCAAILPTDNASAQVSSTNGAVAITGTNAYHADNNPVIFGPCWYGQQAVTADTICAWALPAHAFTVDQTVVHILGTVAAGTGNLVIRVSDGTNNCDTTCACSTTCHTAGSKRPTMSGTCSFSASAQLTVTVQSAGCGTTQPGVWGVALEGRWQ